MLLIEAVRAFDEARTCPAKILGKLDAHTKVADPNHGADGRGYRGDVELYEEFAIDAAEGHNAVDT